MYESLFNNVWSHYTGAIPQTMAMLKKAISAGPVDDATRAGLPVKREGSTAIISMKGPMIKDAGIWSYFGFAGSRDTAQALESAAADKDIESILWVVDSPGGSVDGLIELADTVKAVNAVKPITVQVDGMMASAAVYVTAGASRIYAGRRDLVGSIGTRMMLYDFSEMFKSEGIKAIPIDTGEHKSAGAMGTEITEEQQAEFQRIVDGYFADFKEQLVSGRGLTDETFDKLADGRVFFANEEPMEYGLIDGIQSIQQTINQMVAPSQRRQTAQAKLKLLSL